MTISSSFRGRVAEGAISAFLIVKPGAADMSCLVAAGPAEKLLGTSDELNHVAGEVVDVSVSPIAKVCLGGTVAAGDALTSDANGKAVVTTTTGHRIIGFAEVPGVLNDVITYIRAPGVL